MRTSLSMVKLYHTELISLVFHFDFSFNILKEAMNLLIISRAPSVGIWFIFLDCLNLCLNTFSKMHKLFFLPMNFFMCNILCHSGAHLMSTGPAIPRCSYWIYTFFMYSWYRISFFHFHVRSLLVFPRPCRY